MTFVWNCSSLPALPEPGDLPVFLGDPAVALLFENRGRPLEIDELTKLALTIAERESLWRPLVRHDAAIRQYDSLYVDEIVGVWVICWMPGQDTGFHDHGGARGAVAVAEGVIREERPVWGGPPRRNDAVAGTSFTFEEDEIHRMVDATDAPAVTIHAYSPPIVAMGAYLLEDGGSLRRRRLSWEERLEANLGIAASDGLSASGADREPA